MRDKNKHNRMPSGRPMRARLSFDEGFAERPIYIIKAMTTEKDKGVDMVTLVKHNFNLSDEDMREAFRKQLEEYSRDAFTPTKTFKKFVKKIPRDEKGRIISPFDKKS